MASSRRLLSPIGFMLVLLAASAPLREFSYVDLVQRIRWTTIDAANGVIGSSVPMIPDRYKIFQSEPLLRAALALPVAGAGLALADRSITDRFDRR